MSSRSVKLGLFVAVICMMVSAFQLRAGVIEKAFEALEMKDYFKARELFQKVVRKDRLVGNYGLCLVHITKQNPFYDLDTAKIFALRTESFWKLASEKERREIRLAFHDAGAPERVERHVFLSLTKSATKRNRKRSNQQQQA